MKIVAHLHRRAQPPPPGEIASYRAGEGARRIDFSSLRVVPGTGFHVAILFFAVFAGRTCAQELSTAVLTDGSRISASLAEISENWLTSWTTNDGIRRLDASQLVRWGDARGRHRSPLIALAGGSLFHGELARITVNEVAFRSAVFGEIEFPRRNVRGILWRVPGNALEGDRLLFRLLTDKRSQDVLWTVNRDELTGEVSAAGNDEMPMPEIGRLAVMTRIASDPIVASIDNLVGWGLRSDAAAPPARQPFAVVTLRSGDVLWARNVKSDANHTQVTLLDGTVVSTLSETLWPQIEAIQVFHEQVTYVSDLPDRLHKHIPFLSLTWGYAADRGVSGGLLRCGGNVYRKGIGMHSVARLACALDGKYRRFESEIAVDDSVRGRGSVIFRVYTERPAAAGATANWHRMYESPIVRGGDKPIPISVDVQDAVRLALVVDLADRGDEGDHADWLNARLVR